MSTDAQTVIQQTKNWLEEVVIGLDLCPFAEQPFRANHIDYLVTNSVQTEQHLQQLAECFSTLDKNADIETSLLIFSSAVTDFEDYLELLHLSNLLLEDLGYTGSYQLASFHPDYLFADSTEQDASNFSNRSPYPMLHILRESSIEQATTTYKNIEAVPEINIKKLQKIGVEKMLQTLNHCRQEVR